MEKMENPWGKENPRKDEEQSLSPLKPGVLGDKIGEGVFANVYDVNNAGENSPKKVVKIGITEGYKPPLAEWLKLSFSRKKTDKFLKKLLGQDFSILPDEEFIRNGVAEYMLMKEYFGTDDGEQRDGLIRALGDPADPFYQELDSSLKDKEALAKLADIVRRNKDLNFLPKEQTVIGHPPELTGQKAEEFQKRKEKLPLTFYIFQEKIEGAGVVPLAGLADRELAERPELAEKLLLFSVLTKKMYHDRGKLIDTRPKELLKHPLEWFSETENILIDKGKGRGSEKVFFIDTRLLWSKNQKFIGEKSLNLLEHFGVRSVDRAIRKYYGLSQNN
jgi:hypothetical protein